MTAKASDAELASRVHPRLWVETGRRFRGVIRGSEVWLVLLGALIGVAAGLSVALIGTLSSEMHDVLFGLSGERLSGVAVLHKGYASPIIGGLLLGVSSWLWSRRRKTIPVDPIEANALHGGRMSMRDSLWVTIQTLVSNGFGASVGLEAGYAQIGGGLASKLGVLLRLRRNDLRVLVGCGAGAAIGAAFGAPLTGAFYGFELIIGAYSVGASAAVLAACLTGVLTARAMRAVTYAIHIPAGGALNVSDYVSMMILGDLRRFRCLDHARGQPGRAAVRLTRLPRPVRPALGGVAIAGLALISPQVLAAGHGALTVDLPMQLPVIVLLTVIVLKTLASVVSLGSGFRGGLFFASLFLGAMIGKLASALIVVFLPQISVDPTICVLAGMGTLAVAIVGGPLTMTFLILETTGDFVATTVVLAAAFVTSVAVRQTFGYSFSTWRLHLRGESIRSAIDVGWMRSLDRRADDAARSFDHPRRRLLAEMRRLYPLGSTQRVVVVDSDGKYLGVALDSGRLRLGR